LGERETKYKVLIISLDKAILVIILMIPEFSTKVQQNLIRARIFTDFGIESKMLKVVAIQLKRKTQLNVADSRK